jgi:hypothetical protein
MRTVVRVGRSLFAAFRVAVGAERAAILLNGRTDESSAPTFAR